MQQHKENIIVQWIVWHFFEVPRFLFSVWKNYMAFGLDFFSAPLLLSTLFSPWRRYGWAYPRGFNIVEYANTFVSNMFSRMIGALCRLVLIVAGVFVQIIIFLVGIIVILLWVLIPFIMIGIIFLVIQS